MRNINTRSKEVMRGFVLRLVWGAGGPRDFGSVMRGVILRPVWCVEGPRDFDSGTMAGRCFLPRRYASTVKSIEVFSRK